MRNLTLDNVRDIYTHGVNDTGIISNWNQVGGPNREIHPYVRNRNSGSQETMQSLVMKDKSIVKGSELVVGMSMLGPYTVLDGDPAGIGFTFFYYQRYMSPITHRRSRSIQKQNHEEKTPVKLIQMIAIDGVIPSYKTIADGTYPLVTEVYVVTRIDLKKDHPAVKLRDWLLSEEGQGVIGETGYVPIGEKGIAN